MLDLNHGSGCQYQAPDRDPGIGVAVNAAIDAALTALADPAERERRAAAARALSATLRRR